MSTDATTAPLLLTVPEVAARLRVSRDTVYRRIQRGELPAVRIGAGDGVGLLRIPADELEAWLFATPRTPSLGGEK